MTDLMTMRMRVGAPPEDVHRALTDAAQLRIWLAEHAEVELPDRYAFWGRFTPEGEAPRQRPLHVDDRTLRFAWPLDGQETTVELKLEPDGEDATVIALSQTHFSREEMLSGSSTRGLMHTFWAVSLANLADHMEGRELTTKVDFTSAEMRSEALIDAPAEAVFDSLIDGEKVTRWFGYPIGIEPRVGGRYAMGGLENNAAPAKIVELRPGRALAVDWGPPGVTTWELEDSGGKTRLTVVQSGFDPARPPYGAWAGIVSGVAELRRFHELSDWRPIWLESEGAAAG